MQPKSQQQQHHPQHKPQHALVKAYHAVPPPPSLYSDLPRNPSPTSCTSLASRNRLNHILGPPCSRDPSFNPNPTNGDLERRSRRRNRARRPQDVTTEAFSSCGSNGTSDGSVMKQEELASCLDIQEGPSAFRSLSPNCRPSPSYGGKGFVSTNLLRSDASGELSMDDRTLSADFCRSSTASTCTSNKAKCKESFPSKPKWKDTSRIAPTANGDSKAEKMKYSPKIRADHNDSPDQCCNGILGSRLLPDEASTSSLYRDDEHTFVNLRQELGSNGFPLPPLSAAKGCYIRKVKLDNSASDRSCFQPHWPSAKVEKALEEGEAFRCTLRVNAYMRSEAYVTIDNVPIDILIDGIQAQNRAIDGDTVAVIVNDISKWAKLRGFVVKENNEDQNGHLSSTIVHDTELAHTETTGSSDKEESYTTEGGVDAINGDLTAMPALQNGNDMLAVGLAEHLGSSKVAGQVKDDGLLLESADPQASRLTKVYQDLVNQITSYPDKRPTGQVVAILEKSDRRRSVVGFLEVNSKAANKCSSEVSSCSPDNEVPLLFLVPSESRFPKMMVSISDLPTDLRERHRAGDKTLQNELVAACVKEWKPHSSFPCANISHTLGQGGEIEAQLAAILFEHAVHSAKFPPSVLKCLPQLPWNIPSGEYKRRKDLTACRIFTIDPLTARDLDDALSVQRLDNGLLRVGVHIADVSYFVHPETELDKEAQFRSTSVYLIEKVLPMLPRLLCEKLCSLNPGVDRLTFSIMWDIDQTGHIVDQWIGRTIIRSCCKLSYSHVQDVIDGKISLDESGMPAHCIPEANFPDLHGNFNWGDVFDDIIVLHKLAKQRQSARFEAGALRLQNSRLVFDLDDDGIPKSSSIYEHHESNFVVEEFMLLANMTAAKIIAGTFPDCALLRRHPDPNLRKIKEMEDFCGKSGFEVDASSASALQESLQNLCESLKEDPAVCSIFMLYATKPMQLAKYFSTGEKKNEEEWSHYALATPFYTHFTSPIRRYPDIVVHRTLLAALDAEQVLLGSTVTDGSMHATEFHACRCFTGPMLDKSTVQSCEGQKALATAAMKHKVPGNQDLALLAEHCNRRKLASRNVRDASDKVYLWAMLKKKEGMFSEARVLAVGPKFISIYAFEIAMERRLFYEDTEGLGIEWCSNTCTAILDLRSKSWRKDRHGHCRGLREVAYFVNPAEDYRRESLLEDSQLVETNSDKEYGSSGQSLDSDRIPEPAVLPLTLRHLTSVPVFLFATGGNGRPPDIGVRLYLSSYL